MPAKATVTLTPAQKARAAAAKKRQQEKDRAAKQKAREKAAAARAKAREKAAQEKAAAKAAQEAEKVRQQQEKAAAEAERQQAAALKLASAQAEIDTLSDEIREAGATGNSVRLVLAAKLLRGKDLYDENRNLPINFWQWVLGYFKDPSDPRTFVNGVFPAPETTVNGLVAIGRIVRDVLGGNADGMNADAISGLGPIVSKVSPEAAAEVWQQLRDETPEGKTITLRDVKAARSKRWPKLFPVKPKNKPKNKPKTNSELSGDDGKDKAAVVSRVDRFATRNGFTSDPHAMLTMLGIMLETVRTVEAFSTGLAESVIREKTREIEKLIRAEAKQKAAA